MENELIKQLKEKLELFPSDDEGLYQRGLYDGYLNSINLAESIEAELDDKYHEVLSENKRLKKYIDYKDKFNKDNDKHFFKLGIDVGKTKFNLIDFIRGFVLGMAIMQLINLIINL
jgi:hypothetical protein